MQYKLLGNTGLRVSELCLGAMTFDEDWDWSANRETSQAMFDTFVEAGGNFIDTANVYTNGTSEKMLGEFVGAERDRFVIATKYTVMTNPNDPNSSGNQRKNLMRSLEASLKRLNTDPWGIGHTRYNTSAARFPHPQPGTALAQCGWGSPLDGSSWAS